MTWKRAVPVLVVCAIFDAVRAFFEMFWLFGPLLIGAGVGVWVASLLGGGAVGAAVGTGVGAAATYGSVYIDGVLEVFGVIMAMAIGLAGWLSIDLWLLVTNARIFKTSASNKLWTLVGLGISELPIIGALPGLTFSTFQLYRVQIKHDKKALAAWKAQEAARQQQEQAEFQVDIAIRKAQLAAQQEREREERQQGQVDDLWTGMEDAARRVGETGKEIPEDALEGAY